MDGRTVALCLSIVSACAPGVPHAGPCTLPGLHWMAANWLNAADPSGAQERWTVARDGQLMGSAFEIPQGKSGFAEIMTVRADGDRLSMVLRHFDGALSRAWEERGDPMIFTAASCDGDSVVFDGQGAHAGEHLIYKRTGDDLLITGEFIHQGKPDHVEWRMIKGRD
jgi:hypothetical protein